ncbi:MAG TPA: hypothetical protein VML96_04610 [Egibacteraceae bacterium]|nr:hypothetical protein [Egibacteraceae bacterium]
MKVAAAAAIVLVAVVLAGIALPRGNGGAPDEVSPGNPDAVPQIDSWNKLTRDITRTGSTPELALQAFAAVFGAVPGVAGPTEAGPPFLESGTGAVRLILRHFGELSDEQRRAVEGRLLPAGLVAEPEQSASAGPQPQVMLANMTGSQAQAGDEPPDVSLDPDLTRRARQIADDIAERVGRPVTAQLFVAAGERDPTESDPDGDYPVFGWADPVIVTGDEGQERFRLHADGDRLEACLITLTLSAQLGYFDEDTGRFVGGDSRALDSTLAHEVLHCYHAQIVGVDAMVRAQGWLAEGIAEWAGETYVGGTFSAESNWLGYLEDEVALFDRSYSALGFWAQVDAARSGGLWQVVEDVFLAAASHPTAGFLAAVEGAGPGFLDRWPAGIARRPELGAAWDLRVNRMEVPDGRRGLLIVFAEDGHDVSVEAGSQALVRALLPVEADVEVVHVEVKGHGSLVWSEPDGRGVAHREFGGAFDQMFCPQGTCACPDGSAPVGVEPAASHAVMLAVTGTDSPSRLRITPTSLEEICADDQADPLPGRWEYFNSEFGVFSVDEPGWDLVFEPVTETSESLPDLDDRLVAAVRAHDDELDLRAAVGPDARLFAGNGDADANARIGTGEVDAEGNPTGRCTGRWWLHRIDEEATRDTIAQLIATQLPKNLMDVPDGFAATYVGVQYFVCLDRWHSLVGGVSADGGTLYLCRPSSLPDFAACQYRGRVSD